MQVFYIDITAIMTSHAEFGETTPADEVANAFGQNIKGKNGMSSVLVETFQISKNMKDIKTTYVVDGESIN